MADELTTEEQAYFDTAAQEEEAAPAPSAAAAAVSAVTATEDGATVTAEADPKQPPKMVPHAALHEAREQLKAERARVAKIEEQNTLLVDRTSAILQRYAQPEVKQPAQQELPSVETDPVGHILGFMRQQGATIEQLQQAQAQANQVQQVQAQVATLAQRAQAAEREFSAATPDYAKATDHLRESRHRELTMMGYTDPTQRNQMIQTEALQIAAQALQRGANPAAVLYDIAKHRGYTAAAAPGPGTAPAAQPGTTPAEKVRNTQAGQGEATSLGQTRGTGPRPLTAQRLIEMPEADFAKMFETPEGRALFGA